MMKPAVVRFCRENVYFDKIDNDVEFYFLMTLKTTLIMILRNFSLPSQKKHRTFLMTKSDIHNFINVSYMSKCYLTNLHIFRKYVKFSTELKGFFFEDLKSS